MVENITILHLSILSLSSSPLTATLFSHIVLLQHALRPLTSSPHVLPSLFLSAWCVLMHKKCITLFWWTMSLLTSLIFKHSSLQHTMLDLVQQKKTTYIYLYAYIYKYVYIKKGILSLFLDPQPNLPGLEFKYLCEDPESIYWVQMVSEAFIFSHICSFRFYKQFAAFLQAAQMHFSLYWFYFSHLAFVKRRMLILQITVKLMVNMWDKKNNWKTTHASFDAKRCPWCWSKCWIVLRRWRRCAFHAKVHCTNWRDKTDPRSVN